jgi:hypothetical protein
MLPAGFCRRDQWAGWGDLVAIYRLSVAKPNIIILGHSISILFDTYAYFITTTQDHAAQLMDEILTPIPIE